MKRFAMAALMILLVAGVAWSQDIGGGSHPTIPKTWIDAEIASLEVPLADPAGSPKRVSAQYYYRIPVRPIYKSYPFYAPGREPAGYIERLQQEKPVVLWDDKGHVPRLATDADWTKAGAIVFEAPIGYGPLPPAAFLKAWFEAVSPPVAADGTLPFYRLVVRRQGQIEVGVEACAACHSRVMADGAVIKGAQGNFPGDRNFTFLRIRTAAAASNNKAAVEQDLHNFLRRLYAVPWLRPDPQERLFQMSLDELAPLFDAIPPEVADRHGTSPFYPVQIPDLIGIKDRRYLDRTGLQQHRSIADLMRYAALNQGADFLASHDGFIPLGGPQFRVLPDPDKIGGRYSDEQLYALALYLYSLQPPRNPNKFDLVAARGQKIFGREGCPSCHTPPLYTNNKLTPANGFTIPRDHLKKYDVLPISVGTDPSLTLKTRRGTGYYKVPSLKGVWYRSMFEHNGSVATLEDWFDPRRLRDDYVPTGFKGYGVKTRAVKGHEFGLKLSANDKAALIAFLKTL
jgi:mono/diheme cytochrome c family protein